MFLMNRRQILTICFELKALIRINTVSGLIYTVIIIILTYQNAIELGSLWTYRIRSNFGTHCDDLILKGCHNWIFKNMNFVLAKHMFWLE